MIFSTTITIMPEKYKSDSYYVTRLKQWCKDHFDDFRFFCDDNGGKIYWNEQPLEIEIVFSSTYDKMLFDITWGELIR